MLRCCPASARRWRGGCRWAWLAPAPADRTSRATCSWPFRPQTRAHSRPAGERKRHPRRKIPAVTEAIIEGLRAVPIFATLDDEAIARAAAIAGIDEHAKGAVLSERGLPRAGLFVILDGTVVIELHHRTVELGPCEFVEELRLLSAHTIVSAHDRAATD